MTAEPQFSWAGKTILITGGTGSFGRRFLQTIRNTFRPGG